MDSPSFDLRPIFVPKAADVLAGNLREQILDGNLSEGSTLPNERDLAARSGLSRASVREALRILEVEGLIGTRTGRNGGSEVVRPSMSTVERSINTFIRGHRIRFAEVLAAREAIEPQSARLAALYHSTTDWGALSASHAQIQQCIDDIPGFLQANLAWHMNVVRAGHNELLVAFTQAIAQSVYAATDLQDFNSLAVRQAVVLAHQKVMDAIQAGDADAAGRRMARHVGAYVASVQGMGRDTATSTQEQPAVPARKKRTRAGAATRANASSTG